MFASYDTHALHWRHFSESELGSRVEVCDSLLHWKMLFTLTVQSQSQYTTVKTEQYCEYSGVVLLIVCVVDSDGPCPELVRHRESKWLSLMTQWEQVMEKKSNKVCVSRCCRFVFEFAYINKKDHIYIWHI